MSILGIACVQFVTIKVALFLLRDAVDSAVRNSCCSNAACIIIQTGGVG